MKSNKVFKIVSQKRAWYERLLAAVFFSLAAYVIFVFYKNNGVSFSENYYIRSFRVLSALIILIGFGIRFSATLNHHFNLMEMKYRKFYSVGPIGVGKWHKLKKLDRVSTFLNSRNECEVTIWDIRNNRYKIAVFDEINAAVIYGRSLAKNLEIKFKERK
ncbi:hypothetical protein BTO04_08995 [Polaribacter sp. SA4-10]|uniref:hypothetical protein n=1 Tax=Polaribacter sp. SA4-10 TaxID=754397 RepID=UPI000B3CECC7|nr:hypothetical protein [Polaribacter sp. SA4-10]ARV06812.1 hypothetical protein BTO04_08995 [Polaribacter sp. SA4-10]